MKIRIISLFVCLFALASISFAQTKTKTMTADAVVKNLYAAQKTNKNPFFQTKNRALINQYFAKDLADRIWKDSVDAKGEVGAIDFDPLYYSQDPQVTNFVVEKPREAGGADNAFVKVTFKSGGKPAFVDYELRREANKMWKITGIFYNDGEDLGSILRYWQDAEFKKEYEQQTFKGEYTVGAEKCDVTPTLNGIYFRIKCGGGEDFKLYSVEGTETETAYIYTDEKGAEKGKFVFKTGETSGRYIDASGKESTVAPVK